MSKIIRIALAQIDSIVGDIDGNIQKIIEYSIRARDELNASMIVFPELAVTGYACEDLFLRANIHTRVAKALERLDEVTGIVIIVGYPLISTYTYNSAGIWKNGVLRGEYDKQRIPNYDVFDEKRYFVHGVSCVNYRHDDVLFGINICEDVWSADAPMRSVQRGADVIISLNASPFHANKRNTRFDVIRERVKETGVPFIYVNAVGGQDELIFDGGSFVMDQYGEVKFTAPLFKEDLSVIELSVTEIAETEAASRSVNSIHNLIDVLPHEKCDTSNVVPEAEVYDALVLAVSDYVNKSKFNGAVLGLSGGIDSALTLAIATDALGADKVQAVMMPFRYTSPESIFDAEAEAKALGVEYSVISIEPIYNSFVTALAPEFSGLPEDTTEENLQARARGVILMAISNKKRSIVLTTGNKSEMSVGYATLYGDMAGGFNVLKDVPKTLVFKLAKYRNSLTPENPPIPNRVITRPPSAELAPNQTDEKSLAPYPILDEILRLYVEEDMSANKIIREGFDEAVVKKIIRLVDNSEYKRRQAAVGPKITKRAFGKDRRYPIVNYWKLED